MVQSCMGGQQRIVRFDHCGGHARRRVDAELQFALFRIFCTEPLHQQTGKTGAGTTAERMKNQETLQTVAPFSQFSHPFHHQINHLVSDRIKSSGIIVGRVLLAGNHLHRIEKIAIDTGLNLVNAVRFKVHEDRPGHVLARSGFREERIERVDLRTQRFVSRHETIRHNFVLQAVQLPATVADLHTGLSDMQ